MNKLHVIVLVFISTFFSSHVFAYGSSSSKKACKKPRFSEFTPIHLATVAPQSEFSFMTSTHTDLETIEVNVKNQQIDVVIKKINGGFSVKGKLPENLDNTHARISIKATGNNRCKGTDGWLLKIEAK